MTNKNIINYLLLFGIGITWGSQFVFNNLAVQSLPPHAVATGRTIAAGLCLFIVMLFIKEKPSTNPSTGNTIETNTTAVNTKRITALKIFLIALFEAVIPFYLVAWGQQFVDSSVAAVLLSTIPIFTVILVKLFISDERLTLGVILSVFLGFFGLLVLLWPSLIHAEFTHLVGELAILVSAFSFSCAVVLIRTLPNISPVRLTRNIFLIGAIPLILNLIIFHPNSFNDINPISLFSVIALGVICSACAYTMFVMLVNLAGATFASLGNYLVPMFGAILGVIVLGETIHIYLILSLIIIFSALTLAKIPALNK